MIAGTVLRETIQPLQCFVNARSMALRHPPHHEIWLLEMLEPFGAAAVEALVDRLVDEPFERFDACPHRHVDRDARIDIGPRAGRVAALVNKAPDEARGPFGQAVDQCEIVREVGHARIVDLVADAADIQLRKLRVRGLLHLAYSAATASSGFGSRTPCESAWRLYSSMRRSISGRKCRSRPWTGQAAPSPNAQIVWPSICCVTCMSMSISRFCARPSDMRVSTRHIQPMPSRHGVH